MLRRLLINEEPSFASIGYSHQQLSRVPFGSENRISQFHCPKSKILESLNFTRVPIHNKNEIMRLSIIDFGC